MALNLFEATSPSLDDGASDGGFSLADFYSSPNDGIGFRLTIDKYTHMFRLSISDLSFARF